MLIVENDTVYLTRGDDAVLVIDLTQEGSVPYELQSGDRLVFTVRAMPAQDSPVLIRVAAETNRIVLRHEDTAGLETGQYSADVQLLTGDGKRMTVWPLLGEALRRRVRNWKNMIIMPEVTME